MGGGKGLGIFLIVAGVAVMAIMSGALFMAVSFAGLRGGGGGGGQDLATANVSCGSIETMSMLEGSNMPYENTKLGIEEHLSGVNGKHYEGPDSDPLTFAGGSGAYPPHTPEQERWYFNEYWPLAKNFKQEKFGHKKVLIQSKETKKCVVASIEEAGPNVQDITAPHGIGAGAPPEVFVALGLKNKGAAYDGKPKSNNNRITVKFVKDQKNTPLGPAK